MGYVQPCIVSGTGCQPVSGACEARYQGLSRPGLSPFWVSGGDLSLARSVTGCRPGPAGSVEEARYQGLPRPGLSLGWGVAASGTCPCSTRWRSFGCFLSILNYAIHTTYIFRVEAEEVALCRPRTDLPAQRSVLIRMPLASGCGPVQSFRAHCRRLHCQETSDTWTFDCQSVSQSVSQSCMHAFIHSFIH